MPAVKEWVQTLAAARSAAPEPGRKSALLMKHGTMSLRYYAPRGHDSQTPHSQDEIYIVASGSGRIVSGPSEAKLESKAFGPGDAIFVPAGYVHRFVDFTDDFGTWVIFWGPEGGERA
jgi:mannose-6-phosphate isomerase-like protein (cupin superfamily)